MEPTPDHAPINPKAQRNMAWFLMLVALAVAAVAAIIIIRVMGGNRHTTHAFTAAGQVTISRTGFTPSTIRVKAGTTITWSNQDTKPHQLQGDQAVLTNDFNSGESLGRGDTYSFTFKTKGTFTYHDPLNPTALKGSVIVQ